MADEPWSWSDLAGSQPTAGPGTPTPRGDARYEPGPELGRGGMGVVYAVVDTELGRTVARKELLNGSDAERLRREARITASLEHPGIVPVYDAGHDASGRPWYTMRVASRRTLADAIADAKEPRARLALVRRVLAAAEAMSYAHTRGVVHRDLKPANILVGEHGETQVADWGLAVVVGETGYAGEWGETGPPTAVGTPMWMSPEQARGEAADPRADVYALGAILLAVVTGRRPFPELSPSEILGVLRGGRAIEPRPGDQPAELCAIARRALSADPGARYPDAGAFAAEIGRWLDGQQVLAHTYTLSELLGRQVRRFRVPLFISTLATVALFGTGLTGWWRTERARVRAVEAEAATAVALATSDAHLSRALVSQGRAALRAGAMAEAALLGARALALGRDVAEARGLLAGALVVGLPTRTAVGELPVCGARALSEDGRRVACAEEAGISLWETEPPRRVWRIPTPTERVELRGGRVFARHTKTLSVYSLDGRLVAEVPGVPSTWTFDVSPGGDRAWVATATQGPFEIDVATGSVAPSAPCGQPGALGHAWGSGDEVTVCVDGRLVHDGGTVASGLGRPDRVVRIPHTMFVAASTVQGTVAVIDLRTGRTLHELRPDVSPVTDLAPSADGALLAVATDRGGVSVWRLDSGARVAQLPRAHAGHVRFAGGEIVVMGEAWSRWSAPLAKRPWRWERPHGVGALAVSDDGQIVASAHGDGAVVLQGTDGREELRWQSDVAKDVTFVGRELAAAGMGTPAPHRFRAAGEPIGVWSPPNDQPFRRLEHVGGWLIGVSYAPAGPYLWADGPGTPPRDLALGETWDAAASLDGSVAVVCGAAGVHRIDGDGGVTAVDGRAARAADVEENYVALAMDDAVYAGETGALRVMEAVADVPLDVAISPGATYVAAGGRSGVTWVWTVATGDLYATLRGHEERVAAVEFGADGALYTGGWDGAVVRWDLAAAAADPADVAAAAGAAGLTIEGVLGTDFR